MPPRHARAEDDDATGAPVPPLRLVDRPPGHELPLEPPEDDFSPEVRAVLDAVAALHMAVIGWAAATVDTEPPHHAASPPSGRHRR